MVCFDGERAKKCRLVVVSLESGSGLMTVKVAHRDTERLLLLLLEEIFGVSTALDQIKTSILLLLIFFEEVYRSIMMFGFSLQYRKLTSRPSIDELRLILHTHSSLLCGLPFLCLLHSANSGCVSNPSFDPLCRIPDQFRVGLTHKEQGGVSNHFVHVLHVHSYPGSVPCTCLGVTGR